MGYSIFDGQVVKLLTCSNCNVKCDHCYISFTNNFDGNELYEVVSNLADRFEVRINGTEPLLHPEYLKSIQRAHQTLILTNGLVFKNNYDYIDQLKAIGIKTIGISYHFEWHDSISKVDKAYLNNLFDEIINRGVNVQIMTTINSLNYQNIGQYCQYCVQKGIKRIRFTNFIAQGKAKELDQSLILNDQQREEFFNEVDMLRSQYPKEVLKIQRCGSFGKNVNSKKEFVCGAGQISVVLTPDLNAYPCLFMAQPGNEIGYYQNGNIYINDNYKAINKECMTLLKYNKKEVK